MVTGRILLAATMLGAGLGSAAAAPAPTTKVPQLMQSCDAHKFETVVKEVVDGQPQQSKVKLCGNEGQSDADWIVTLKDAVAKLTANTEMPAAVRDQIITALKAEIGRLESGGGAALAAKEFSGKDSALAGISPLPPLPQPKAEQVASLPPPRVVQTAPSSDYAALPPLPTAPTAPTRVLAGGVASLATPLPKPRMSFSCFTPGEAEGPCTGFTRETMITVVAGENLPADTSLRFVRDGDPKADVELAQLKKGKSMRLAIPTDVCRHAVGGKLELRIIRAGQEVGSDGPYNLNC
jgi:hypothetical protein